MSSPKSSVSARRDSLYKEMSELRSLLGTGASSASASSSGMIKDVMYHLSEIDDKVENFVGKYHELRSKIDAGEFNGKTGIKKASLAKAVEKLMSLVKAP